MLSDARGLYSEEMQAAGQGLRVARSSVAGIGPAGESGVRRVGRPVVVGTLGRRFSPDPILGFLASGHVAAGDDGGCLPGKREETSFSVVVIA